MPACGTLLSCHLVLKTSVPPSICSILHSPHFIIQPFSLWLLLCFLISSSSLCSVLGADVPCCEKNCLKSGWPYLCVYVCVYDLMCVCRIPVWVSLVQQWNSHLVSVLLPAPPNWRAPFLLQVSHSLWWVINLSDRATAVIRWAFAVPLAEFSVLYTQPQFPVRMDEGLKMSNHQTRLWCPT